MMRWFASFTFILLFSTLYAQTYPKGYFRSPLDTPLYLSANFGAIRGNHFHSGIDIRTFGKEGLPVKAIADGYVARIKISPFGYGNALYINHPNGYTSVYAHLQTFDSAINQYVKEEQYKAKSFAIDVFPSRNSLKVEKGQLIALSGNSGGSTGAHLHFEIRDTKSEETINPQLFGFDIEDNYPPRFKNSFLIYEKNDDYKHQTGHHPYVEIKQNIITKKWGDTVKVKPGSYSFAVWADDYTHTSTNDVGINYLWLLANNELVYSMKLDRFAFSDSRKVNAHIEYDDYKARGLKWHKCYVDDGNDLDFYNKKAHFINIGAGENKSVAIKAFDAKGFADSIYFILKGDTLQPSFATLPEKETKSDFFYPQKNNTLKRQGYSITIPKWALYDTIAISTQLSPTKRKDVFAPYIRIMNGDIPLQKSFTITIKTKVPEGVDTDKLVVVRLSGKGLRYKSSIGGKYSNGYITASTNTFGTFSVVLDNTPPTINKFAQNDTVISVRINDNLAGIETYNAYIDDTWWLMEYDAKQDKLIGILPADLTVGKHDLKIIVTDERNNSQTFTKTIEKK